ncbi:glycerophosphodiester phosphodiesterase [Coraliomargarita sp. W4R53]
MSPNLMTGLLCLLCLSVSLPLCAEPLIVAHRGSSRAAPENTLEAFKLAWAQGADAIEGDFHLTKDGKIVCIHDRNTERVSGVNAIVRQSTLADLRKLDVGLSHVGAYSDSVIPTLEEVLATVPDGKKIYIEIKCGPDIVPILLDTLQESALKKEQMIIICFNKDVLRELKSRSHDYKVSWLRGFKKDESGVITPSLENVLQSLAEIPADGLSSDRNIPVPYVSAIKEQGYEWHVWTVDDARTAKRISELEAVSITTNVPKNLREYLME